MLIRFLTLITLLTLFGAAQAESTLTRDLQSLKGDILQLDRDLALLEQELLYPSTQAAIFVSLDVGTPIRLVDVNLTLDGQHIGYRFYTDLEFDALRKGGIDRVFDGNIPAGKHLLKATITGYDPQGKDYQKTTSYQFTKNTGKKFIEIRVVDDLDTQSHKFEFKEWEK